MNIKFTPRERQIAMLKQRGAMNKEIAIVLGVTDATVKSLYKKVCEKCNERGIDVFAMPVERNERLTAFQA
ncbi:MAG: hypothetical protein FGM45_04445, partial [Actinobacteria bacterium]|nr:hypothetical protein [Actinomycetota bacterium]